MTSNLLINVSPVETRVALVEQARVREIYIERPDELGITGNIYKGRVDRVLPGMQAAFVDVGLDRAAFLYAGDVLGPDGEVDYPGANGNGHDIDIDFADNGHPHRTAPPIQELLKAGQEVLVQVAKEPLGTKGARVTSHISLPGRYLVYMPLAEHVGVSRRIESVEERERLRTLVDELRNGEGGFIVRTVAEGASDEELLRDISYLRKSWQRISARREHLPLGRLVHQELSVSLRAVRDILTPDIDQVIVDDAAEFEQVREFLDVFEPSLGSRVELYTNQEPLFDRFGIEIDIQRMLARKVWLPSGGYIVIDSFEALTAIDVNTGRYVGKRNFEETVLKTNLEAVAEIVSQLRLRNIGGIIVIDFIDMERISSREKVQAALADSLRADKARTTITKISDLGIVEMTRKRIREPVLHTLAATCPYCDGHGWVRSCTSVAHEILRQLVRELNSVRGNLGVRAHPDVITRLREEDHQGVAHVEEKYGTHISLESVADFHQEHFEIRPLGQ